MATPTIIIDGKEIPMKTKARLWNAIVKFDKNRAEIPEEDIVEKYCEIIAYAFGVTTDEVLDNLELNQVADKYIEIYKEVNDLLYSYAKKNESESEVV